MKYYILPLLCFLVVSSCFVDKVAVEPPVPIIEEFKAEPISVNEGDPVSLSIQGSDIESCIVLANGDELELSLSLTQGSNHIPARDTEYEVICKGAGGKVRAVASVNIIIADDIVTADLLSEIGARFDIEQIKAKALEGYEGYELTDYSDDFSGVLPVPAREVLSLADQTETSTFSTDNSIIYGYEGNLDTSAYDQQCMDNLKVPEYLEKANLDLILDSSSTAKTLLLEDKLHITDFSAVTQSLENPIPQGTVWDVSFGLSQTEIDYNEEHADYGEAKGLYSIQDGPLDYPEVEFFPLATFPAGYPVPPKKNDYEYDPNHETCNTATPQVRQERVYKSPGEYCGPGSHFQGSLPCETGIGLPPSWPYTHVWYINGQPIDNYIETVFSRRVVAGSGVINCAQMFPSLVSTYNISESWKIDYNLAQWFVYDSNWPSCGGFNCPGKSLRIENDTRYSNVEPSSNQCIKRRYEESWTDYVNAMLEPCKSDEDGVFKDAYDRTLNQGAVDDMITECNKSDACKNLVESLINAIDLSLFASEIRPHVEAIKTNYDASKEAETSFIIELSNKYFSKHADISKIAKDLEAGYSALVAAYNLTNADWNEALKQMTGITTPLGFQSPGELQTSINDYKASTQILDALAPIEITSQACLWDAQGRFRRFDESRLLEIRKVELETPANKGEFTSIAPVTID